MRVFNLEYFLIDLAQAVVTGLLVGGTYALMCVGLGMIFGVMRVINFAQGDFLMLGMYAAFYLMTGWGVLGFLGPYVGPVVAGILAGPIVFAFSWVLHRYLVRRVTGVAAMGAEAEGHYAQIILTLGIALVLQNGGLIVFGSIPVAIKTPMSGDAWELFEVLFNQARTVNFGVSIGVAGLLFLFLTRSRFGRSLRAAADNPEAAIYMGINVERCHRFAFALGCGVTAIAGGLIATSQSFQPYIGFQFVIIMYAGVVLGGLGSILGAFWGGMVIGMVQQMSTMVLPFQLQNTAVFVVFLLIIFLRPQGLFGRVTERT